MRSAILLSAVVGLAAAAPRPAPQGFDDTFFDAVDNIPTPTELPLGPTGVIASEVVTIASTSITAAAVVTPEPARRLAVRDGDCSLEPAGSGPIPGDGSPDAYLTNSTFATLASSAVTPSGYSRVFYGLHGSTSQIGYKGLYTLTSYDPAVCAAKCAGATGCVAFNLYIERDPSQDAGLACPNPAPITNYKCTLYAYTISADTATNTGQYRGPEDANGNAFKVVITASNGYNLLPPPVPAIDSFTGVTLPGAIDAPNYNGKSTYMGVKIYTTGEYDASQCATACLAQTAYNSRHPNADGTYNKCNFFNSYQLSKNGVPQGTYCSLYNRQWAASYATNKGQTRGTDRYDVSLSMGYTLVGYVNSR